MPETGSISSFNVGLKALIDNEDSTILQQIVKETLSVCPSHRTQTAKAEIAAILQRKYLLESRKAGPSYITQVDKKYYDLSMVLKSTPVMNREESSPSSNASSKLQLPARSGSLAGLAPTLLKGWFEKKKPLLKGTAIAGAAMCGLIYLYNKIWGQIGEKKKIPLDRALLRQKELQDFEKTVKSLEHIRAFSQLSRNPNLSGKDYSAAFKNPSKLKKPEKEQPVSAKLAKWNREESSLFKEIDQTAKIFSVLPAPKRRPPAFLTNDDPLPKLSKLSKVDSSPIFNFSEPKKPRARKSRTPKEDTEDPKEEKPAEPAGKIVPVTKRAKKVRKIPDEVVEEVIEETN